jgi:hypothetical protein
MIVDWHAHVYPPELAKERRWGGTSPLTIENLGLTRKPPSILRRQ